MSQRIVLGTTPRRGLATRRLVALLSAVVVVWSAAQAQTVLYDNGPLITHPGAGPGGSDHSTLQTAALGMTVYGYSASAANDSRVADDFEVTLGGWQLATIDVYGYQVGSGTTSSITGANFRIWDGPPGDGESTVLYGATVDDRLVDTDWDNAYRVNDEVANPDRPIMLNQLDAADVFLPAGTYWLDWQLAGSLPSGPSVPAVTELGVDYQGNALSYSAGSGLWTAARDTGTNTQQALPFVLHGDPAVLTLAGQSLSDATAGRGRQNLRAAAFAASTNVVSGAQLVTLGVAIVRADGTTPSNAGVVQTVKLFRDADGDLTADDTSDPLGSAQVGDDGTATIDLSGATVAAAGAGGFVLLVDLKSAAATAPTSLWFGLAALLPSAVVARIGRRRLALWLVIAAAAVVLVSCGGTNAAPVTLRVNVTAATASAAGGPLVGAPLGTAVTAPLGPVITVQ